MGATAMAPATPIATMGVVPVAAIDESSSTIGFADSDLYFMTPTQVDAQLDQMQALGVNNVRVLIPWAGVEPFQGYFDWSTVDYVVTAADARGMGVLGVLNSTPAWAVDPGVPAISGRPSSPAAYGDFAGLVATRYAGRVAAYEVWNEPNGATFYAPQPDPAGYTDLLKAAYPEIKAADPNATVIGGVLGAGIDYGNYATNPVSFLNGIYAAGGEKYFDALSYHPYQYTTPFSQGGYLPDSPINQVTAMHDIMVANGDADKLIWASEYGEPTSVATEAAQAAYLQDMLTTWSTLGYTGPTYVYTLQDRSTGSTNAEDTFGVVRSDGTWKPAAYVIQQLAARSATTPAMARMALALPDAQQAAPADLAAVARVAARTYTVPAPAEAAAALTRNTLAAAGQAITATLQQAEAMITATMPPAPVAAPGSMAFPPGTAAMVTPTTVAAQAAVTAEAQAALAAARAQDAASSTQATASSTQATAAVQAPTRADHPTRMADPAATPSASAAAPSKSTEGFGAKAKAPNDRADTPKRDQKGEGSANRQSERAKESSKTPGQSSNRPDDQRTTPRRRAAG